MAYDPNTYDDGKELTEYLWHNYQQLLTELESRAASALLIEEKAANSSPHMAKRLRQTWGLQNDPAVMAALADGRAAFRDRVRDRLLRECADSIVLNRCEKCSRLVATPRARQCLWCGHDWH